MANYKGKIKITLLAIIFLISIFGLLFMVAKMDKRPDEEKILDSMIKTGFLDTYDTSITIEFLQLEAEKQVDHQTQMILNILRDISIHLENRYNKQTKEVEGFFDIRIRKTSMVKGHIFSNNQMIVFECPLLYDKPIYMEWKDIETKLGFNKEHIRILYFGIEENLNRKAYRTIKEFEAPVYIGYFQEFIEEILHQDTRKAVVQTDDKIIETKKYKLVSNEENWESFCKLILNTMLRDQKLETTMNRINTRFLFDKSSIDYFSIDDYADFTMESDLYIDKNDTVRKSEHRFTANINNLLEEKINVEMNIQTITHKANEGILFQKIQLNDAINITKFNQQELEDLKLDINNSIIRFIDSLKGSNHDES